MTAPTQAQQKQPSQQQLAWLAAWLVLNHQSEQKAIAANVVTRLAPLWKILDFHDLKNTQTPWIQAVLPVVADAYSASRWAAQRFAVDYRHANLPAAPELPAVTGGVHLPGLMSRVQPKIIADTAFPVTRATVSLLGTGPGEVMNQMPAPQDQAMDAGRVLSSKVAIRISIDGGRQVVRRAVDLDHEAVGWARVLNVDPCYFCAMLASRGAVFKHTSFDTSNDMFEGEGVAKVHDGCRCGIRPVYSHSDSRDPTSEALWQQWKAHTKGASGGKDMINAFRKNYTEPAPPEVPRIDMHSLLVQRNILLDKGFAMDSEQVHWIDQQIARFGAILDDTRVSAAATPAARRPQGTKAASAPANLPAAKQLLPH